MHGTGGGRHAIETHIFAHTDNLRHKAIKMNIKHKTRHRGIKTRLQRMQNNKAITAKTEENQGAWAHFP